MGRNGGVAERLVRERGLKLATIDIHGLNLSNPGSVLSFAAALPRVIKTSRRLLREFGADVVVGAAGYVSVPIVLAARREGIPVVLLEQNARPGRATRLLASRAQVVAVSFDDTASQLKRARVRVVGNPVRKEFLRDNVVASDECRRLLVMGGSQGARRINVALMECAPRLLQDNPDISIVHQCGALDEKEVKSFRDSLAPELQDRWDVEAFYDDLAERVAASDLVIMRAGGSSLAEVSVMGLPMILIPYPHAGDHQRFNAAPYVEAGAATLIPDAECDANRLCAEIENVIRDPNLWQRMAAASRSCAKPGATTETVKLVMELGRRKQASRRTA